MWYARSAEFLKTPVLEIFRWLRSIGDTIFAVGILALGLFVIGLSAGWFVRGIRPDYRTFRRQLSPPKSRAQTGIRLKLADVTPRRKGLVAENSDLRNPGLPTNRRVVCCRRRGIDLPRTADGQRSSQSATCGTRPDTLRG